MALGAVLLIGAALWQAGTSPLLAWRDPLYVAAGLAGVAGLALLLAQPLLIGGAVTPRPARRLHAMAGAALAAAVALHVAGLWVTSPPDVVDVLLFRSPTPFGAWGAVALWAAVAAALLALARHRLPPRLWRVGHVACAGVLVVATVLHAWLIQGTMGTASKALLCVLAPAATVWAVRRRGTWRLLMRPRRSRTP
ncbi:ferric reductase [Jannaschia sp. LMIT008]|uniref:ferric reductase n=1 Tax=Jannaschia maritima TaxID=3032585 RepID=UPI0028115C1A|nr:ferric reductase [Jannaschia sp. LMIT008]